MKKNITAILISIALVGCGSGNSEDKIESGLAALSSGNYREATIEFKSALQRDHHAISARIGLVDVFIRERKINEAITELDIAMPLAKTEDQKAQIHERLAYSLFEQQMASRIEILPTSDMTVFLLRALGKNTDNLKSEYPTPNADFYKNMLLGNTPAGSPDNSSGYIAKALSYLYAAENSARQGDTDGTIAAMRLYLEIFPSDAPRQLRLIDLLVNAQRFDEAKPAADKLYAKNKQHALLNELMGVIALQQKRYDEALSFSLVPISNDPNNIRARITAALSEVAKERPKEALSHLDAIINILPKDNMMHYLYADLLISDGNIEKAGTWVMTTSPSTVEAVDAIANTALTLQSMGYQALSKAIYNDTVNKTDLTSLRLGVLALSLNDETGIKIMEDLSKKTPGSELLQQTVASAYLASGDMKKAEQLAHQWLASRGDNDVEANMLLAVVNARTSNYSDAEKRYSKVLSIMPEHVMAKAGLIETYVAINQSEKAETIIGQNKDSEVGALLLRHYAGAMLNNDQQDKLLTDVEHYAQQGDLLYPAAKMIAAQIHFKKNEYSKGLQALKSDASTQKEPGYWLLFTMLNQGEGNTGKTVAAYEAWLLNEPSSKQALTGLVSTYRAAGDLDKAVAQLHASKQHHKDTRAIDMMLAELFVAKSDWSELLEHMNNISPDLRKSPLIAKFEGVALFSVGRLQEAENKLSLSFETIKDQDSLRYLVATQERLKQFERAKTTLLSYTTEKNDDPLGFILLGNNRGMQGDWRAATFAFKKAIELGASDPLLHNNYAYSLMKSGSLNDAMEQAKIAVSMSPGNLQLIDTLASIHIEKGDAESAYLLLKPFWDDNTMTSKGTLSVYIDALLKTGRESDAIAAKSKL